MLIFRSTDLHNENVGGPVYDLPMVMSKLLHLGMPLEEVIRAVTLTPAAVMGEAEELGSMSKGTVADVTALRLRKVALTIEDSHGVLRYLNIFICFLTPNPALVYGLVFHFAGVVVDNVMRVSTPATQLPTATAR